MAFYCTPAFRKFKNVMYRKRDNIFASFNVPQCVFADQHCVRFRSCIYCWIQFEIDITPRRALNLFSKANRCSSSNNAVALDDDLIGTPDRLAPSSFHRLESRCNVDRSLSPRVRDVAGVHWPFNYMTNVFSIACFEIDTRHPAEYSQPSTVAAC